MTSRQLKIALGGDSRTGKTCLVNRYIDNDFSDRYKVTIGADFRSRTVEINGELVTLQIWDISGQYRSQYALTRNFFKDSSGIIITFSLSGYDNSLSSVAQWKEQAQDVVGDDVPIFLVGTKSDLGIIDEKSIETLCEQLNFHKYFQTSAKTNSGVIELFDSLIKVMLDYDTARRARAVSVNTPFELQRKNPRQNKMCPCL